VTCRGQAVSPVDINAPNAATGVALGLTPMDPTGQIGLVFVPGAGLGGWIWEAMEPRLEFTHLFAEFPGREDADKGTEDLRLEDYARHLRNQVDAFRTDRLAIVAHSLGGLVALKLAAGLSSRLVGFVGVGAAVPRDGGSFVSSLPFAKRAMTTVLMRLAGTRPPESAIRRGLCSDLPASRTDEVVRRFVPESRAVYVERADAPVPDVPRMYVRLTADKEFGLPLQGVMAGNLGAAEVREIDSGHLPMLSNPDELAALLNEFAADLGSAAGGG
jgi:pimeloyl-ACP methyl ester carboxylesterase